MDGPTKERLLGRVISGTTHITIKHQEYIIKEPVISIRLLAGRVYDSFIEELKYCDILTQEELLGCLVYRGLWDAQKEEQLEKCETNIDQLKIGIFESFGRSIERETARKALRNTETLQLQLLTNKHSLDYLSIEHIAQTLKLQYLLLRSLYDLEGNLLHEHDCIHKYTFLLDVLMSEYSIHQLDNDDYRELASCNTWQDYWCGADKEKSLFGKPAVEYTLEQRLLVSWSRLYDNIRQSTDAPSEEVMRDNDALDGWLILEGKKRKAAKNQATAGDILSKNPHLARAEEIYLLANTDEDAKLIDDLNTPVAKFIKKQKLDTIAKKGHIHDIMLPDQQQRLIGEYTKLRRG